MCKKKVAATLVAWFDEHGHPWVFRKEKSPYPIWIIEVMAQQTQLSRAVEYYQRWQQLFPDVFALAAAGEEAVLRCWEGLGYYSRARNLLKAARIIVNEHNGKFPVSAVQWRRLPGVGPYTAAAVASIVHGEPVAAVDANVRRVVARYTGYRGQVADRMFADIIEETLQKWFAESPPGKINEALMELGERICLPRETACERCPLREQCTACREELQHLIPAPRPKKRTELQVWQTAAVMDPAGRVWLVPSPGRLWRGLWILPRALQGTPGELELLDPLPGEAVRGRTLSPVFHAYTRYKLEFRVTVYTLSETVEPRKGRFFDREELEQLPLPSVMRKILHRCFREN